MPEKLRKYSWIIIVALLFIGGTIYFRLAGGPGFAVGVDSEKIGIVYGEDSNFIMFSDMDSISLINKPELGEAVNAQEGNGTVYGTYKNDIYGTYELFIYNKSSRCIEIRYKDGTLLLSDSNDKKTDALYIDIMKKSGK